MTLSIPNFCLVVLVGPSDEDNRAFAARFFADVEPLTCAASDVQDGTFDVLCTFIEKRLAARQLTLIDASHLGRRQRGQLLQVAKAGFVQANVFLVGGSALKGGEKPDGASGASVSKGALEREGFRHIHDLRGGLLAEVTEIERERVSGDMRNISGPFDLIGDVHGCAAELIQLFDKLGYAVELKGKGSRRKVVSVTPEGRRAVFVGDLVDRGPRSPDVLRIVMHMVAEGQAVCVPGNHDVKLLRWFNGRKVKPNHGLDKTIEQLKAEPESFSQQVSQFIDRLAVHAWLHDGALVVAHAGIKPEMFGRSAGKVREFCLYGETSGETDEFGLPIRYNWAAEYDGAAAVIYGHTPVPEAEWLNNTLCIDTGCVFGGKLTALRWPEREIVSVPAARAYAKAIRAFGHPPTRPAKGSLPV